MPTTPVRAFVSYAHADSHVQEGFATRLAAAQQQGAFEYWADAKIDPGASWDAVIRAELHKADIALLLVSNAFLGSKYCREEMLALLRKPQLFWVIVDDCVWRSSPLREWQSCATSLGMTPAQIQQTATRVVDQIVQSARRVEQLRSPAQKFLLENIPGVAHQFTGLEALPSGRHCWVHRATARFDGHDDDEPVVIKVLLKNPSDDLVRPIEAAADVATTLRHPSFIRLRRHYLHERLPALVMENVDQTLLRDQFKQGDPFPLNRVRDHLVTLAEAFAELHDRGGTYGLLTSHNVFIDANTQELRFAAISITGQLSQIHQGWQRFIGDDPASAPYLIPEQFENDPWSAHSDQYVLGQLAVEMLTGSPLPPVNTPEDLARRDRFFADPLGVVGPRIRYHRKFAATLARLLQRRPAERFATMRDAVTQLRQLDDEDVAFARHAYKVACDQTGFFDDFYARLFMACPGAHDEFIKAHRGNDPQRMADQARALRLALNSALVPPDRLKNNLEPYVEQHRTVPAHFFPAFAQTFVATLEARPGPPLPLFILDAVRSVLDRAALHLNPATAGRDVEEAI